MKRIVLAVFCAAMAAGMLFAGGKKDGPAAGGDASLTNITSRGKFVLGLDDAFPPMGYRNEDNEIVGYDVDLAKEVAKRIGVELVLQPIDWDAKEQELNTGEIDCIWNGFTITEERKANILYTPPYLKNAQVVVVKGNSPVNSLKDLTGKTAGTQAGSSSVDAIDEAPEFKSSLKEVIEYKDFLTALMDLDVGGIDAVVIDLVVANDNINRSGKDFRILKETLGEEEFGIGFRKNDKALADKVWETLLAMAKDGTVAKIATKWLGADISIIGK
ncbi:amino acid ABC transporter substrate-binding protein [Leadbettera azotonutricia]|uniref:Extracellular solute-binding protein, family 3 n=1 Tax=Leadbettera azotonutricia (strain ATCC BAA-888 / DSM 13862 / ZAS-9) TaxID=545695 RepID=F5YG25_LEAAZ|nr:amino acid ABC transporter substrate-binding protein [Leadbettera azotonutricia]AEF80323.1 extracellular solute-binding protein, family 3 [Leadbettera azotonutricia ZAS-9]